MYKDMYVPNLNHFSENAINFAGLSSNGIPTAFGWYDLFNGEVPYMDNFNMIKSIYNELDDLGSYFK